VPTKADDVIVPAKKATREVERLLDLDVLELAIGHGLAKAGQTMSCSIASFAVREQIAVELGILGSAITVHDSRQSSGVKRLRDKDPRSARRPRRCVSGSVLAIDTGEAPGRSSMAKRPADPARHRLAYWITESQRDDASCSGLRRASEAPP
jgi:flagellar biosynthesis component FlhA